MKLNDQQLEALRITQEECAEVIQAISKVMRFGLDTKWNDHSNQERLEEEIGDLQCMIEVLKDTGILDPEFVRRAQYAKRIKLQTWSNIFNGEAKCN